MQVLTTTRSPGEVLDGSQGCVCSLSSRSASYLDLGAGVEGGVIRVEDDVAAARRLRGKTGTDVRAGITLERAPGMQLDMTAGTRWGNGQVTRAQVRTPACGVQFLW